MAELHRIKTDYYDALGNHRRPSDDSLTAVLGALGVEATSADLIEEAIRRKERESNSTGLDAVTVRWGNAPIEFSLCLPQGASPVLQLTVFLEDGGKWEVAVDERAVGDETQAEKAVPGMTRYRIPCELPFGYHRMTLEGPGGVSESLLIAAPEMAFLRENGKAWGLFAPVFALRSKTDWGAGSLTEFETFSNWIAALGGRLVGTLPLFATFFEEPFAPSPYTPASRLFWNEIFADPLRYPHWQQCDAARGLVESSEFQRKIARLHAEPLVDYRELAALKKQVFSNLAEHAFRRKDLQASLEHYAAERPELAQYARFRALSDRYRKPWPAWPEPCRSGNLTADDVSQADYRYHLFVQWLTLTQLDRILETSRTRKVGLYLDLPLGVHPDGFDVWRYPESFAHGVSGGAPPDAFFTEGQDWGFRPLHPIAERRSGYAYLRAVLANLMGHADVIRIDHALSLQRLYWVPFGMKATEGAYVYYPMDELFAIVVLESHRNRCVVVGEDLGTVSPELRRQMDRRGIFRMYVGQFELDTGNARPWNPVPRRVVASLNTHDTPTAAGFWHGDDITLRKDLGLLSPGEQETESQDRANLREVLLKQCNFPGPVSDAQWTVLKRWLTHLSTSEAEFVLVTLEDLLQERKPHNVPGTIDEFPNWRRKASQELEGLRSNRRVIELLTELRNLRAGSA